MSSETTIVAAGYRIHKWAEQIRDCQNRPSGMSVADWCTRNGITKANYYYRLRRVRAACLENIPEQMRAQQIVPVEPGLLQQVGKSSIPEPGLDISMGGASIHVTGSTPMPLLAAVLEVVRNAQ